MAKSSKMYANSPSVKKDADGKAGISRPTEASATDAGVAGIALPQDSKDGNMPIQVKQVQDMHERHQTEMKDMHKRHQKEHEKLAADHAGGGDIIDKVEGTT